MLVLGHVDTQWVVASRTAGEVFFTVWTVLGSHAKEIAAVSVYKLKKKKKKVTSSRCRAGKKKKIKNKKRDNFGKDPGEKKQHESKMQILSLSS